jgi:hypothetical protein
LTLVVCAVERHSLFLFFSCTGARLSAEGKVARFILGGEL